MMSKQAVRKLIRDQTNKVSHEAIRAQSQVIRSLPEYKSAVNIAYYLHMDHGELETSDMIENAFADGKSVFLPRIVPIKDDKHRQYSGQKTELEMLRVRSAADIEQLKPAGKYKLREPQGGLDDLIILPGMAFTKTCKRIGHGKGYYDSYIGKHRAYITDKRLHTVAVGLTYQLLDDVPCEPHDQLLDAVVIDNNVFRKL